MQMVIGKIYYMYVFSYICMLSEKGKNIHNIFA